MERRFKKTAALAVFFAVLFFNNDAVHAETVQDKKAVASNVDTAASLEMIAERMKALSGSLAAIPEPPRLNQVIQIPEDPGKTNTDKEPQR